MRRYAARDGDRLRDVVSRFYAVEAATPEATEARIQQAIKAVQARMQAHSGLIPGAEEQLAQGLVVELPTLPRIRSIPEPALGFRLHLNLGWYVIVWLLGILVVTAADHSEPLWQPYLTETAVASSDTQAAQQAPSTIAQTGTPIRLTSGVVDNSRPAWLRIIGPRISAELTQTISALTAQFVPWTVGLLLLWLYRRRDPSHPYVWEDFVRYAIIWLVGVVFLVSWENKWLADSLSQVDPGLLNFTRPLPLVLLWTAAVLFGYVMIGDRSIAYRDFVGAYRGVWTSLIVTLTVAFLAAVFVYDTVDHRVQGLLIARGLATSSLTDVANTATDMSDRAKALRTNIGSYPTVLANVQSDEDKAKVRANLGQGIAIVVAQLQGDMQRAIDAQTAAMSQLDVAIASEGTTEESTGMSLLPIRTALAQVSLPDKEINKALTDLTTKQATDLVPAQDPDGAAADLLQSVDRDLLPHIAQLQNSSRTTAAAVSAVGAAALAFYLWAGAFFGVVVFFPWMLVLLFLFRKRLARASQIRDDLTSLDPIKRVLLNRVLNSTHAELKRSSEKSTSAGQDLGPDASIEEVANRAFSNFDYLLNLTVLTILLAVGLYYVFYPDTITGVAVLVEKGGGVSDINTYFTGDLQPLTLGFAGAYFWLVQALLRRYFAGDLYPTVLLQSCVRLLVVFILSLLLGNVAKFMGWDPKLLGAIAFFAGITPNAVIQGIGQRLTDLTKIEFVTQQDAPLTNLDGLTVWSESRLLEENIENVYGMATARMEQLVLRTHFSTGLIVDWVDQAILYTHAGKDGYWFSQLRSVGIRSASQLLSVAGWPIYDTPAEYVRDVEPDMAALGRICSAVAFAQEYGPKSSNDAANPMSSELGTLLKYRAAASELPPRVAAAQELLRSVDMDHPETFDRRTALWQKVEAARDATQAATNQVAQLLAVPVLTAGGAEVFGQNAIDAHASMQEAMEFANSLEGWMPNRVGSPEPERITQSQTTLGTWLQQLLTAQANITPVAAATAHNGHSSPSGDSNGAVPAPRTQANELSESAARAIQAAVDATGAAYSAARRLDPADPRSYNVLIEAGAQLDELQASVEQCVAQATQAAQVSADHSADQAWSAAHDLISRSNEQVTSSRELLQTARQDLAALTAGAASASTPAEPLQHARSNLVQADQDTRAALDAIERAVDKLAPATARPRLTPDILHVICTSIWPDPNLEYVLNYKNQTINPEGSQRSQRTQTQVKSVTPEPGRAVAPPPPQPLVRVLPRPGRRLRQRLLALWAAIVGA